MFRIFAVTLAGGLIAATGLALPGLAEEGFVVLEYRSHGQSQGGYRVQKGDTLASIVAAQLGQVHDLAATYDMIVAQNPHAFVQADPNRLIAGKVLTFGAGQHSGSRRDDIYFF